MAEYDIQIDNGMSGQIYKEFDSLSSAIDYAKGWAKSLRSREDRTVLIHVGLADLCQWEYEGEVQLKSNLSRY